jgi:S1-C subfamily serine protease
MRTLQLPLLLTLLAVPAFAQQATYYKLSTGTGFVINNDGHVVTNEHVVQGCQSISILTAAGEKSATLVAADADTDLAVVKTAFIPKNFAPLRLNIDRLAVGDDVVVMGYPGTQGANGQATYKRSRVTGLLGPNGQEGWIQLTRAAEHGNSGGPVLDTSGNVIGVVRGMALTYRAGANGQPEGQPVSGFDIAITLPILQNFLRRHSIGFYQTYTGGLQDSDNRIAEDGREFIVSIRCVQGTETH